MNNLIVLAVLATTVVVHSETTCNDTYDIEDFEGIRQQYDDNLDCVNNIKCKNVVTQFTNTAGNLISNEVLFIIKNSDEEFKFKPGVYKLLTKLYDDTTLGYNNLLQNPSNTINIIMGKFTPICQRYTNIMAHKHYLQRLLFDGNLNNATVIVKLILVIIKLQLMANSLQTAQVCVYSYIY